MIGYKGFDKDLKCRDKQYKIGKTFKEDSANLCVKGMHFCENPFDVFNYYPPTDNRFCEVVAKNVSDDVASNDSKRVCSEMKIHAEIGIKGIIEAGVRFIFEKTSATTGNESNSEVTGDGAIAAALGKDSKVKGAKDCWIVAVERGDWNGEGYPILDVKTAKVDGETIKENTFYMLVNGEFMEVE